MKRSRWMLTLSLAVVAAGLVVGTAAYLASSGVSAQSSSVPDTVAFMPASADMVGYVDIAAFLSSPSRDDWEEQIGQKEQTEKLEEFRAMTGMDPLTDFYAISFAMKTPETGGERSEQWGLAMHGEFDSNRLVAKLGEHGALSEELHEGTALYRFSGTRSGEEHALAFPQATIALFGPPEFVRTMLDVGAGRSESVQSGVLQEWSDLPTDKSFWVAGETNNHFGQMWRTPDGAELPPLRSFALSGRLDAEVNLRVRGKAADAEAAQKLAEVVRGLVALGSLQSGNRPEMSALVDSVQIGQLDDEVEVSVSVPYETIRALRRQAEKKAAEEAAN